MESTNKVLSYLKTIADSNGRVSLSLAKIGNEIGLSVATVHRIIKKLEYEGELYIEHSKPKNKPDVIVLLNTENDIIPIASKIESQTNNMIVLIKELTTRITDKQKEIAILKTELEHYKNRNILNEIKLTDDITAVLYRN